MKKTSESSLLPFVHDHLFILLRLHKCIASSDINPFLSAMANDTRQSRITPKHATTSFHSHSTKLNFPGRLNKMSLPPPVSMTSTTSVFNNLVILFTRKTAGKIEKLPEHGFAHAKPLLVCQCTLNLL